MRKLSTIPDRLSIIIGPPSSPPELKQSFDDAYDLARDGDNKLVEELRVLQKEIAEILIEGGKSSCLAKALETLIEAPIEHLEAYVG